ncbi:hypothetical protein [Francisella tularensis]|uniref:hypothetical protein n=1 Tax=Francisella tularensis TaxID=263 RepID=UPI0008F46B1B|nr:hypothetical protein [Francisella tularensis]APA82702.1 hypothetical protein N894_0718 [Francisella tularensis subsp. novicida PA10-7858]
MATLRTIEKRYFEELFGMGSGYVLDTTNLTFAELFRDTLNIDIYDHKYSFNGDSKAKRLRAFWEIEENIRVGKILKELLDLWKFEQSKNNKAINTPSFEEANKVVNRLLGIKHENVSKQTKNEFLSQEFLNLRLDKLDIDFQFENIIRQRLDEIEKSLNSNAYLSVVLLCGSTLEGLLHDKATKNIRVYNTAKSAPKDKDGKVLQFDRWTLNNLIDVSFECKFIEHDIKEYSHSLRAFRNYIHPREQALHNFSPDTHTAQISWKVLQATIASLGGMRKN